MGGFAKLKEDFDRWFPALDLVEIWKDLKTPEAKQQSAFRHLYLRCLFEIAGNLDTIALCSRAVVEQLEKLRIETTTQETIRLTVDDHAAKIEQLKDMITAIHVRLSEPPKKIPK